MVSYCSNTQAEIANHFSYYKLLAFKHHLSSTKVTSTSLFHFCLSDFKNSFTSCVMSLSNYLAVYM